MGTSIAHGEGTIFDPYNGAYFWTLRRPGRRAHGPVPVPWGGAGSGPDDGTRFRFLGLLATPWESFGPPGGFLKPFILLPKTPGILQRSLGTPWVPCGLPGVPRAFMGPFAISRGALNFPGPSQEPNPGPPPTQLLALGRCQKRTPGLENLFEKLRVWNQRSIGECSILETPPLPPPAQPLAQSFITAGLPGHSKSLTFWEPRPCSVNSNSFTSRQDNTQRVKIMVEVPKKLNFCFDHTFQRVDHYSRPSSP